MFYNRKNSWNPVYRILIPFLLIVLCQPLLGNDNADILFPEGSYDRWAYQFTKDLCSSKKIGLEAIISGTNLAAFALGNGTQTFPTFNLVDAIWYSKATRALLYSPGYNQALMACTPSPLLRDVISASILFIDLSGKGASLFFSFHAMPRILENLGTQILQTSFGQIHEHAIISSAKLGAAILTIVGALATSYDAIQKALSRYNGIVVSTTQVTSSFDPIKAAALELCQEHKNYLLRLDARIASLEASGEAVPLQIRSKRDEEVIKISQFELNLGNCNE